MVVSGPSGSGKTTLCRQLADRGEVVYSTSCTTRQPRPGEVHGRDYYFLTTEEFQEHVARGDFFEYAQVHGNYYGTLKSYVKDNLTRGVDVIMDIDVQGAAQVRSCDDALVQRCLVEVIILLPSLSELEQRLAGRGTEDPEKLKLRLNNALEEVACWPSYQYALVSATREEDLERFRAILLTERMRVSRLATP